MAGDDDLPSLDDWGPVDDDFWGSGSFLVPPPPPPPSLGSVCSGAPFYCEMEGGPMGAHFDRAAFPSLPIIAVCSSVVLVAVLVASFLLWRHKSKVQNLLPCKNEQQGHLGELGAANGVTYEDVLINHHPTRLPQAHIPGTQALMPLEILDVKLGEIGPPQITTLHHHSFYPGGRGESGGHHHQVKPFHHPLYEEVERSGGKSCYESDDFDESGNGGKLGTSDDDFAEDEFSAVSEYPSREGSATSSVRGSTGGDLCRDPASSEGEDCDYAMGDPVPDAVVPFGYHGTKHLHAHPNSASERPDRTRGSSPRNHLTSSSYPLAERTVVPPPAQRITEPPKGGGGNKTHSTTPLKDCNRKQQQQQPAFLSSPKMSMPPPPPANAQQWPTTNHEEQHYPTGGGNSSQENIYSTIDEEDYPSVVHHHPSLTSLACPQRGNPSSKHNNSAVPKSAPVRDRPIPTLSQRNADDNGSSYGDIMPAFNSASFT